MALSQREELIIRQQLADTTISDRQELELRQRLSEQRSEQELREDTFLTETARNFGAGAKDFAGIAGQLIGELIPSGLPGAPKPLLGALVTTAVQAGETLSPQGIFGAAKSFAEGLNESENLVGEEDNLFGALKDARNRVFEDISEDKPELAAFSKEMADYYIGLAKDPIGTIRERPFDVFLDALAIPGILTKGFGIAKLTTSIAQRTHSAASIRRALIAAGLDSKQAAKFAGPLHRAIRQADPKALRGMSEAIRREAAGKVQAVLARTEEVFGGALGEVGKTRGARPLRGLAIKETELSKQTAELAKIDQKFTEAIGDLLKTPDQVDEVQKLWTIFNQTERLAIGNAEATKQAIRDALKAGKITEKKAARQMRRADRVATKQLKDGFKRVNSEMERVRALPRHSPKATELARALRNRQKGVKKAKSRYEAHTRGLDKHTPADVANMPLINLRLEGEVLTRSRYGAFKDFLDKNFLDPSSGWVRFMDVFDRESTILQRTSYGSEAASRFQTAETIGRSIEAGAVEPLGDVLSSLKRGSKNWVSDHMDDWYRQGMPSEWAGGVVPDDVRRFGNLWKKTADGLWAEWARVNGWTGKAAQPPIDFYLPNAITNQTRQAFIARDGALWERLKEWAETPADQVFEQFSDGANVMGGGVPGGINGITEKFFFKADDLLSARLSPSLEFPRPVDLPSRLRVSMNGRKKIIDITDRNPLTNIGHYLRDASRRIGIVGEFGKGTDEVEKLLQKARKAGDDRTLDVMRDTWASLQGIAHAPGFYTNPAGRAVLGLESGARALHLSAAVIPNLTGIMWVARKWGLANAMKAQWTVLRAKESLVWGKVKNPLWKADAALRLDMDRRYGGWARNALAYQAETELLSAGGTRGVNDLAGGRRFSSAVLNPTGLGMVERNTNRVAGMGAMMAVEDMLTRLRKLQVEDVKKLTGTEPQRLIRELKRDFIFSDDDIARIMSEGMSEADQARVVQRAPALVNAFNEGALGKRRWMRHPVAVRTLAYMSWRRVRGNMVFDAIREAQRGNWRPLMKEFGYSMGAGLSADALRNFSRNQEAEYDFREGGYLPALGVGMMESSAYGLWGAAWENFRYAQYDVLPDREVEAAFLAVLPPVVDFVSEFALHSGDLFEQDKRGAFLRRNFPALAVGQGLLDRAQGKPRKKR